MCEGNEIIPYYFVFYTSSGQTQHPLHPLYHSPANMFCPLPHLLPSTSNIQPLWLNKASPLPTHHELAEAHSPQVQNTVSKGYRKVDCRSRHRRIRNPQKELESAKKNSESNLINQLFSFFNSYQKSEAIVQKAIRRLDKNSAQLEEIKSAFYNIVRLINFKRGRKYVNRESILAYYSPETFRNEISCIDQKLQIDGLLKLEEVCLLFRVVTAFFIRNISVPAVLTSKRITATAKFQHLKRRRRILSCLKEKLN